jgi:Cu2+-exporting ATPase
MKVTACIHCGSSVPKSREERLEEGGKTLLFCCRGCLGAYLLITGAGLGAYYERRTASPAAVLDIRFDEAELSRHLVTNAGDASMDILLEGIRCAACVWLVERLLEQTEGVRSARVNYATARARVVFDPSVLTPASLFQRIARAGYVPRPYTPSHLEESRDREKRDLLVRFGTAFFLTMQLMAYSFALYAGYLQGMSPRMKGVMQLFSLVVTLPVVFYSGWPFLLGAWRGLQNRSAGMDLLIATGALSSLLYSIHATLTGGEVYYETAAMIVTLILAGRLLENAARRRAAGGVERLLKAAPSQALVDKGDGFRLQETSSIQPSDLVLVPMGGRFPVDGTLCRGETEVDESPATGESMPVMKGKGDEVLAGSVNLGQEVVITASRPASESFIARVARLVEEAQARKAPIQGVADRVAGWFVPAVILLGMLTYLYHAVTGATGAAPLMAALSVVVIACPCALGLATPTAVLAGTGAAAGRGIIFRGGDVLERLSSITTALFDKTGTLTEGRPEVIAVHPFHPMGEEELLFLAATVEQGSTHPVARGICSHAEDRGIDPGPVGALSSFPGRGVQGEVQGRLVQLGTARWLEECGVALLGGQSGGEGTEVHLALDGVHGGRILLADRLRPRGAATVAALAARGVRSVLVSGDRQAVVASIAAEAGITDARGELLPQDKVAFVEYLQQQGERLLMAGDGINDAGALAAAQVGCALAGGTDIAIETSDLILVHPDLDRLAEAHGLAIRTMAVIRQNLWWAFVYNLVGIPLAMTGRLTPIYAAAAMSVSSLCVVLNSLRLLRTGP